MPVLNVGLCCTLWSTTYWMSRHDGVRVPRPMPSKTHQLRKIADNLRLGRGPCWICGQPIDYSLPHDDEMAFTVEHIHPRSTHKHLENDPGNCVAAHARCNKARQDKAYAPSLGTLSEPF